MPTIVKHDKIWGGFALQIPFKSMGDLSPFPMYPVIYAVVVTWFYEAVINDLRLLSDNQERECNN